MTTGEFHDLYLSCFLLQIVHRSLTRITFLSRIGTNANYSMFCSAGIFGVLSSLCSTVASCITSVLNNNKKNIVGGQIDENQFTPPENHCLDDSDSLTMEAGLLFVQSPTTDDHCAVVTHHNSNKDDCCCFDEIHSLMEAGQLHHFVSSTDTSATLSSSNSLPWLAAAFGAVLGYVYRIAQVSLCSWCLWRCC